MRKSRLSSRLLVILGLLALALPAEELWRQGDSRYLALNPTLKLGGLLNHNPDDAVLYPDEWATVGLSRLRLDLHLRWDDAADARLAYVASGRWTGASQTGTGFGILPTTAPAPYRLRPVQEDWYEGDHVLGSHELDRALVAFHPDWGEVTIGRQAIGLGRGVLFSAVDLFAPFSPLEIDREWRRGVDALRVERRVSPNSSVEAIAVGGESWDDSALIGRWRGYMGVIDAELLGGKRGEDGFLGTAFAAATGDAEVHGELAVFRTRHAHPQGSVLGDGHLIPKAVLGASYTLPIGTGLTVLGEYHYSGFGSRDSDQIAALLSQPEYRDRYLRGDTQILGRHAVGLQASYSFNEFASSALNVVTNPTDGSGVLSPSLRLDLSRTLSITVAAYLPWGEETVNGLPQSEYGGSGQSLFLQLGLYF